MKFKSTLLLLIVSLAFVGYFFLFEAPKQESKIKEFDTGRKVFAFDTKKVSSFAFSINHDNIELKKEEGKKDFLIVKPIESTTETRVIERLFNGLNNIRYITKIDGKDANLSDFKLDSPNYRITLDFDDGSQKILSFGNINLSNNMIYANISGDDTIYLVDLDVRNILDLQLNSFRDKKIIKDDLTDLAQIQVVQRSKGDEVILKKEADGWVLAAPKINKADTVGISAYINNIRNLKAVKFPNDTKKFAKHCDLTKPDLSIILTSTTGEIIQSIIAVAKGPQVQKPLSYDQQEQEDCLTTEDAPNIDTSFIKLASEDGVYLIDYIDFTLLDKSYNDLRMKPVFSLSIDDVHKLKVIKNKNVIIFARDENKKWGIASGGAGLISYDDQDVSSIFNYLNFIEAAAFIDDANKSDARYGFKDSQLLLSFYDKSDNLLERMITGNEEGNYIYLQKVNDPTVYMIDKTIKDRFDL